MGARDRLRRASDASVSADLTSGRKPSLLSQQVSGFLMECDIADDNEHAPKDVPADAWLAGQGKKDGDVKIRANDDGSPASGGGGNTMMVIILLILIAAAVAWQMGYLGGSEAE